MAGGGGRWLNHLLLTGLVAALAIGCASSPKKQAAAPSSTAPAATSEPVATAVDPSPNTLRDRRNDPGVRAPAKPLVIDNAKSVKCGKLAKGGEGDEADLLAGRLRVRAPSGSKAPPLTPDAPSVEEESRVVTMDTAAATPGDAPASNAKGGGNGKKHAAAAKAAAAKDISLAIVARETFQLDPDLYEPEEGAPTKPGSLDVEAPKFLKATFFANNDDAANPTEITPVEIGTSPKLRAYAARPKTPNAPPGKDTALVLALLVAQDDGALESVAFYVRGEPVRNATGSDLVGCTRLAERIASSIAPGPRKLERSAGKRHVADLSPDEELAITVPADYVAVAHNVVPPQKDGADKTSTSTSTTSSGARLTKLRPLSLYAGSIVVALNTSGAAPKVPEGADATAAGKLLGHPMEWRGKTSPKGGFFFAAEPIADDKSKTAEVLVKATRQAKALDEMRAVAETLTVVKRAH